MIRDGERYNGEVSACSGLFQSPTKGTVGFAFSVRPNGEDKELPYIIWLKPEEKSIKRAKDEFSILGITTDHLASASYMEHRAPEAIMGRPVSFTAKAEEFEGRTTMKAAFLGRQRSQSLASEVAAMFGGEPTERSSEQPNDEPSPFDDEEPIPF